MNRIAQFLWLAAYLACVVATSPVLAQTARMAEATNIRCIDGDTFACDVRLTAVFDDVDLHWGVTAPKHQVDVVLKDQRVRILALDAWELSDGERGKKAKAALESQMKDRFCVSLVPQLGGKRDSFGRILASVTLFDAGFTNPLDVTTWMLKHGHGVPYKEGK